MSVPNTGMVSHSNQLNESKRELSQVIYPHIVKCVLNGYIILLSLSVVSGNTD